MSVSLTHWILLPVAGMSLSFRVMRLTKQECVQLLFMLILYDPVGSILNVYNQQLQEESMETDNGHRGR